MVRRPLVPAHIVPYILITVALVVIVGAATHFTGVARGLPAMLILIAGSVAALIALVINRAIMLRRLAGQWLPASVRRV